MCRFYPTVGPACDGPGMGKKEVVSRGVLGIFEQPVRDTVSGLEKKEGRNSEEGIV